MTPHMYDSVQQGKFTENDQGINNYNSFKTILCFPVQWIRHQSDVIMGAMASQITGITIVYSTVCSDADQRKYQSSALLAFVKGIHRWSVNSPHKEPVTRKIFPFDDVIMSAIVGRGWFFQRLVLKFRGEPLSMMTTLYVDTEWCQTNVNLVVAGGTGGCHYANFVVIDDARRWHHDNLWCHQ